MKCQIFNRHQLEQEYLREEKEIKKRHLKIHKIKYNQRKKEELKMISVQLAKTLENPKT